MNKMVAVMVWGSLTQLAESGQLIPTKDSEYPKLLNTLDLDRLAYSADDTGEIQVTFEVDVDGRVCNPWILNTFNVKFNEYVLDAVERLEFIPALQNGVPVQVRYVLPIVLQ